MSAMKSKFTGVSIVCSIVCSGTISLFCTFHDNISNHSTAFQFTDTYSPSNAFKTVLWVTCPENHITLPHYMVLYEMLVLCQQLLTSDNTAIIWSTGWGQVYDTIHSWFIFSFRGVDRTNCNPFPSNIQDMQMTSCDTFVVPSFPMNYTLVESFSFSWQLYTGT